MNTLRIFTRRWGGVALALLAAAALADDANWPRFRGPNGDGIGVAPGVPALWTTNDYRWTVKLPGVGHSSPVVWGPRLFVTCGEPETGRRLVLCLDAASGRILWQREFASRTFSQNGDNSYATASPAADADGVVVTWTTPDQVTLLALDNAGREIWRRELGRYVGIHGSGASPILLGDLVLLDNNQEDPKALPSGVYAKPGAPQSAGASFLIAVDRKTGQTRWQLDRASSQAAYITPCIYRPEGGAPEIILANTVHGITGVDAATGKVDWELSKVFRSRVDAGTGATNRLEEPLFSQRCIVSPIVADGLIVAGEGRGSVGLQVVAVRPGSKTTAPALAYDIGKSVPQVPTPLAKDNRLYLWTDGGAVSCLRTATGEVVWRERVGGSFYSSPVWANGRLYCAAKNGDVVVLAAADKFEVLGRVPLGEKCFATPAIAGGVMYWRTFSHLFALGGQSKPPETK